MSREFEIFKNECRQHDLSWTLEYCEPSDEYSLEVRGPGESEHWYVKKSGWPDIFENIWKYGRVEHVERD